MLFKSNSGILKIGNLSFPEEATSIPQSSKIFETGVCKSIELLPTCLAPPKKVNLTQPSILSGFHS